MYPRFIPVKRLLVEEKKKEREKETEYVGIEAERMWISSKLNTVSGVDFHPKKKNFLLYYVKTLKLS